MQSPFRSAEPVHFASYNDIPRIWGSCEMYTQFVRDLASYGMVVIAIEHEVQLQLMELTGERWYDAWRVRILVDFGEIDIQ